MKKREYATWLATPSPSLSLLPISPPLLRPLVLALLLMDISFVAMPSLFFRRR